MRLLVAIVGLAATLYILWLGFDFLRDRSVNKWVIAVTAVIWGVGGSLALYYLVNSIVESLPDRLSRMLQPYVFVGPAVGILIWYLALPVVRTFRLSLLDRNSQAFVGLENYIAVFTERQMRQAFLNNIAWILVGATLVVLFGLIVALLADRSTWERFAKAMIFLPMAISMVGAAIIWQFMYIYRDISAPQIGLVNAIVVALGGEPRAWLQLPWPVNNLFLIAIVVWLQAGYAMTLFSAAIKGIPADLMEAARVDGANEWQVLEKDHAAADSGHAHYRGHHRRHLHLEDLRCGARDDGRSIWHAGDRH